MRLALSAMLVFLSVPACAQETQPSPELQAWYLCVGKYVQNQRDANARGPMADMVNAGMKECAAEEVAYAQALVAAAPKADHEKIMLAMRQEVAAGLTAALERQ